MPTRLRAAFSNAVILAWLTTPPAVLLMSGWIPVFAGVMAFTFMISEARLACGALITTAFDAGRPSVWATALEADAVGAPRAAASDAARPDPADRQALPSGSRHGDRAAERQAVLLTQRAGDDDGTIGHALPELIRGGRRLWCVAAERGRVDAQHDGGRVFHRQCARFNGLDSGNPRQMADGGERFGRNRSWGDHHQVGLGEPARGRNHWGMGFPGG